MTNKDYRLHEIFNFGIDKKIIKEDTDYKLFYSIIRDFNKEVATKVIEKGYKFKPGFGIFEVRRFDRKGKSIDWDTSKKIKQAIIDRGGIPFDKELASEGEKWFYYFEGKDYYKWHWCKDKACEFISNIVFYCFKEMTQNRRRIGKVIKDNPFADLDYGVYK